MDTRYLDLVDEVCPVPLLRIQEALRAAGAGDTVVARLGYARSVRNVMEWAEREGIPFSVGEAHGGVWQITLRKEPRPGERGGS